MRSARSDATRDGAPGRSRTRTPRQDHLGRGRDAGVGEARPRPRAMMATSPGAMQLRTLQTMAEISAERNSTIIFPIPVELLNVFQRAAGPDRSSPDSTAHREHVPVASERAFAATQRVGPSTLATPTTGVSLSIIEDVVGREVLDSRGNPTVEVEVELVSGARGPGRGAERRQHRRARGRRAARRRRRATAARACATPSTTSTARSPTPSSGSTPPTSACSTPSSCALDGTDNKGRLGANAILGVSLAVAKAAADECGCRCTATSAARTRTCCRCR